MLVRTGRYVRRHHHALGLTTFLNIISWLKAGQSNRIEILAKGNVKLSHNDDGSVLLESDAGACILKKSEGGVKAVDMEGNILHTSKTGADNKVRVYNADGSVVRTFDKS